MQPVYRPSEAPYDFRTLLYRQHHHRAQFVRLRASQTPPTPQSTDRSLPGRNRPVYRENLNASLLHLKSVNRGLDFGL